MSGSSKFDPPYPTRSNTTRSTNSGRSIKISGPVRSPSPAEAHVHSVEDLSLSQSTSRSQGSGRPPLSASPVARTVPLDPVSPVDQSSASSSQQSSNPYEYGPLGGAKIARYSTISDPFKAESLRRTESLNKGRVETPSLESNNPLTPENRLGSNLSSTPSLQPPSLDSHSDHPQHPPPAHTTGGSYENVPLDDNRLNKEISLGQDPVDGASFSTRFNRGTELLFDHYNNPRDSVYDTRPMYSQSSQRDTVHPSPMVYDLDMSKFNKAKTRESDWKSRICFRGVWTVLGIVAVLVVALLGVSVYALSKVPGPGSPSQQNPTITPTMTGRGKPSSHPPTSMGLRSTSSYSAAGSSSLSATSFHHWGQPDPWQMGKRQDSICTTDARTTPFFNGILPRNTQTTEVLPTSTDTPVMTRDAFPSLGEKVTGPPGLFFWPRRLARYRTCIEKLWFLLIPLTTFFVVPLMGTFFPLYIHSQISVSTQLREYFQGPGITVGQAVNESLPDVRQGLEGKQVENQIEAKTEKSRPVPSRINSVVVNEEWVPRTATTALPVPGASKTHLQDPMRTPLVQDATTTLLATATPQPTIHQVEQTNNGVRRCCSKTKRCCSGTKRCCGSFVHYGRAISDCYLGIYAIGCTLAAIVVICIIVWLYHEAKKIWHDIDHIFHQWWAHLQQWWDHLRHLWGNWEDILVSPVNATEHAAEFLGHELGQFKDILVGDFKKIIPGVADVGKKVGEGVKDTFKDIGKALHIGRDFGVEKAGPWPDIIVASRAINATATMTMDTAIPEIIVVTRTISATAIMARDTAIPEISILSLAKKDIPLTSEGTRRFSIPKFNPLKWLTYPLKILSYPFKPIAWLFQWSSKIVERAEWLKRWLDRFSTYRLTLYFWGAVWVLATSLLCIIFILIFIVIGFKFAAFKGKINHISKQLGPYIAHPKEAIQSDAKEILGAAKGAVASQITEVEGKGGGLLSKIHPRRRNVKNVDDADFDWGAIEYDVPETSTSWDVAHTSTPYHTPRAALAVPTPLAASLPVREQQHGMYQPVKRGQDSNEVAATTTTTTVTSTVYMRGTAPVSKRDEPLTTSMLGAFERDLAKTTQIQTNEALSTPSGSPTTTELLCEETDPPQVRSQIYTNAAQRRYHAPLSWESLKRWLDDVRNADDSAERRLARPSATSIQDALSLTTTTQGYREAVESIVRRAYTNAAAPKVTKVLGVKRYMTPREESSAETLMDMLTTLSGESSTELPSQSQTMTSESSVATSVGPIIESSASTEPSTSLPEGVSTESRTGSSQLSTTHTPDQSAGPQVPAGQLTKGEAGAQLHVAFTELCFVVKNYGNVTINKGVTDICQQREATNYTYVAGLDPCLEKTDADGMKMVGNGICAEKYNGTSEVMTEAFKRFCGLVESLDVKKVGSLIDECSTSSQTFGSHPPATIILPTSSTNADMSSSQGASLTTTDAIPKRSFAAATSSPAAYTSWQTPIPGLIAAIPTYVHSAFHSPTLAATPQPGKPSPRAPPNALPPHAKLTPPAEWKIEMLTFTTQAPLASYKLRTVSTNANPQPPAWAGAHLSRTWADNFPFPIPTGYVAPNIVPKEQQVGHLTHYTPGLGACGFPAIISNELSVAISWVLFDLGKEVGGSVLQDFNGTVTNGLITSGESIFCNRFVRVWMGDGDKKVEQRFIVRDRCTACNVTHLDIQHDVFKNYWNGGPEERISVTWEWMEGAPTGVP